MLSVAYSLVALWAHRGRTTRGAKGISKRDKEAKG